MRVFKLHQAGATPALSILNQPTVIPMNKTPDPAPLVHFTLVPKGTLIKAEQALTIEEAFAPYALQFKELSATISTITDPKAAQVARLKLRKVRTDADKKHEELKRESLNYGRALDTAKNLINEHIRPLEEKLKEIEEAEERRLAQILADRRKQHLAALAPYLDPAVPPPFVDGITDDQFAAMLDNAKLLHQAKIERLERLAKEEEERQRLAREEQARQQAELDRLREEALQREEILRQQREEAERLRLEQEERHRKEQEATAAQAKKLKDAADAKLKKEREAAEKLRKEQEAKFAAEREEAERKAEYDRQVAAAKQKELDEKARREREELEQKAKAERLKREELERQQRAAQEAEARRKQEEQEAAERAAQAPDKEKLLAYLHAVLNIPTPTLKSAKAKKIAAKYIDELQCSFENFADEISKL